LYRQENIYIFSVAKEFFAFEPMAFKSAFTQAILLDIFFASMATVI
jgi:hypothetical protein